MVDGGIPSGLLSMPGDATGRLGVSDGEIGAAEEASTMAFVSVWDIRCLELAGSAKGERDGPSLRLVEGMFFFNFLLSRLGSRSVVDRD